MGVSMGRAPDGARRIIRQEEHHRERTFQEEYLEFLQESGINYDARYVWYYVRTGLAPLSRLIILLFSSGGSGPPKPGRPSTPG